MKCEGWLECDCGKCLCNPEHDWLDGICPDCDPETYVKVRKNAWRYECENDPHRYADIWDSPPPLPPFVSAADY